MEHPDTLYIVVPCYNEEEVLPETARRLRACLLYTSGFIKVVYHAESGAVLGAQLMCERATDLIGEFTLAVAEGRTVERMAQLIRPHPTFGEGISEAAESCLGLAIHQLNR